LEYFRAGHTVLCGLVEVAACWAGQAVRRSQRTGLAVGAACTAVNGVVDVLVRIGTARAGVVVGILISVRRTCQTVCVREVAGQAIHATVQTGVRGLVDVSGGGTRGAVVFVLHASNAVVVALRTVDRVEGEAPCHAVDADTGQVVDELAGKTGRAVFARFRTGDAVDVAVLASIGGRIEELRR
jgi:hypothetical protein